MQKEARIRLADACMVIRRPEGEIALERAVSPTRPGAGSGSPRARRGGGRSGSPALSLLVSKATGDAVPPRLSALRGHVLETSLSDAQEQRLREALGDTATA